MKKVYISGKITGLPENEVVTNFKFAESRIKAVGLKVFNPMSIGKCEGYDWNDYMDICIKELFDCDTIYMMNNWMESKGSRIEKAIAEQLNLKFLYE